MKNIIKLRKKRVSEKMRERERSIKVKCDIFGNLKIIFNFGREKNVHLSLYEI